MRGRRIAFDFGTARIGVAICDPDGILATPLPFIDARKPRYLDEIARLFDEYEPIHIYIGKPQHLSGADSESVAKAESFAETLRARFERPITFIDERMSTIGAQKLLQEAGKNVKESRHLIDSMSAVAILESGLALEAR